MPCASHFTSSSFSASSSNTSTNTRPMIYVRFRIVLAFQRVQEALLAFHVNDVQTKWSPNMSITCWLRSDAADRCPRRRRSGFYRCAVQQHRGHGGVHAAGEAEDHFVIANLLADTLNGVVDDFLPGSTELHTGRCRERSAPACAYPDGCGSLPGGTARRRSVFLRSP